MVTFVLYTFFVVPLTLGFAVLILLNMRQRIETARLRGALRDIAYLDDIQSRGIPKRGSLGNIARAALGEDK